MTPCTSYATIFKHSLLQALQKLGEQNNDMYTIKHNYVRVQEHKSQ